MLGVSLSFYKNDLKKVPVHVNKYPVKALDLPGLLKPEANEYIENWLNPGEKLESLLNKLPLKVYSANFEQLCKIKISSVFMMDESIETLFKSNQHYRLVRKIDNSMWRWGCKRPKWNELVDAYNAIRSFSLDKPGFTVRLDYTTGFNERGYSEYTRTYLDGVFAYVVYYKGQHVMTLGFSIAGDNKILVQQVQLKNPRNNRWLFKLPPNYLEYILDQFAKYFPRHKMYLITGRSLYESTLASYQSALERVEEILERYKDSAAEGLKDRYYEEQHTYIDCIAHIKSDCYRIISFYGNIGAYKMWGVPITMNRVQLVRISRMTKAKTLGTSKVQNVAESVSHE